MELPDKKLKSYINIFITITFMLTCIGFLFIYSSSSVFALEKFGSATYFLKKQLIYFIPSLLGFFLFSTIPIAWWKRRAPILFLGSLILTALTLISSLGLKVHGSNRWLYIGGIGGQPSELLKLFLFMYIGFFLERKQHRIRSFWQSYLPFWAILGISFAVLLKQPDFGSVMTILTTSLMLFFVAQFRTIYLLYTLALAIPAIVWLVLSKAYRINRILIFLNPWSDPQGRGFQIIQSLIAIGSGNFWGLGISNSRQKFFYLPMQHTDFIFSIIAEETGFIGALVIISLYLLFCLYGFRLVLQVKDLFAFFTALGFVIFISLQAAINLMVTTGLLPTKGLSLPFISYGGTAMISLFCMVGFIVNAGTNSK
ncbi:putative lipid II flippase FtsW [Candidatus Dependentiae bacterium]|nr:putative lipid II flippase FtsW [Candidatus Dependentiae bacterium]